MKAIDIATAHEVSESYISHLRHKRKFTDDISLAVSVSMLSGRKPIEHINARIRKYVLAAHPELNKRVKASA